MKSKEQKRIEAAERKSKSDAMPLWERELLLAGRPGESKRECARIRKLAGGK